VAVIGVGSGVVAGLGKGAAGSLRRLTLPTSLVRSQYMSVPGMGSRAGIGLEDVDDGVVGAGGAGGAGLAHQIVPAGLWTGAGASRYLGPGKRWPKGTACLAV